MSARRLPVYLVLDCSASMAGEPIKYVGRAIEFLLQDLRSDPMAMETVYLSVITFNDTARQVVPLTELMAFNAPEISASGKAAIGAALKLLRECIEREVVKTVADKKGDYKPIVFLMSAGCPTDGWQNAANKIAELRINLIVCAAGGVADTDLLRQLPGTDSVVPLMEMRPGSFRRYFKWASQSIRLMSILKRDIADDPIQLPPLPPAIMIVPGAAPAIMCAEGNASMEIRRMKDAREEHSPDGACGILKEKNDLRAHLLDKAIENVDILDSCSRGPIATPRGCFEPRNVEIYDHPVDCSLFAPPDASAGSSILMQVHVHLPAHAGAVAAFAKEFDSDACRRGYTSLGTRLFQGAELEFELSIPGIAISDPVRRFIWRGRPGYVSYQVSIPAGHPAANLIGKLMISQESVPVGQIAFKLRVFSGIQIQPSAPAPVGSASRYTTAFISYAAKDRAEVLRRVQMLPAVGIRYFQDVFDLEPGAHWEQELYRHIDDSDVMFLFWSTSAKESNWVEKEWQYGLAKKGEDYIRPVIIEGPPSPEPPAELKHLHFSDKVLYFIGGNPGAEVSPPTLRLIFRKEDRPGKWVPEGDLVVCNGLPVMKWHVYDNIQPQIFAAGPDENEILADCLLSNDKWLLVNRKLLHLTSPNGSPVPPGSALELSPGTRLRLSTEPHGRMVDVESCRSPEMHGPDILVP